MGRSPGANGDVRGKRANDGRSISGRGKGGLSEHARRHVLNQILVGDIAPGTIIQIAELARELDISRTPAREALLSLQESNVVSVVPNQGFLVRSLSVADVKDIYLMRSVLEAATSERAAGRMTDAAIGEMENVHAEASNALANGPEHYTMTFDKHCHDFHRLIAAGARSTRLLNGVDAIFYDHFRIQTIATNPPDTAMILEEHQRIMVAITERDPARARAAMMEHIETLRKWALAMLSD